ncbi:MAG: hypothetical protein HUK21_00710 [Fibrobacteraceae bacterium]|nr:hypothetical protein [Fibrobacteraceae bacterium]
MNMFSKIKSLIFFTPFFIAFSFGYAQDSGVGFTNSAENAFSHLYVSLEGGEVYPWGELIDAVENSLYGGIGVRYSYWENVDGIVLFHYSYFKPVRKTEIDGAHQFSGKLGLDWSLKYIRPIILGAGFACSWARADMEDGEEIDFKRNLGGTLVDNETEFGWFSRINVPLWNFEKMRIGFNLLWEQIWTLPNRSNMMTAGVYVERKIW